MFAMKHFLTLLILIYFSSCQKVDVPKGTPKCIKQAIRNGEVSKVDKYSFQGEDVYVYDDVAICCDQTFLVVNDDCEELGFLGGISGNTIINGGDFSEATFIENTY